MKFSCVKNTSARSRGTSIRICRFLAFKLLYQIVDFLLSRLLEVIEKLVNNAIEINLIQSMRFCSLIRRSLNKSEPLVNYVMNVGIFSDEVLRI